MSILELAQQLDDMQEEVAISGEPVESTINGKLVRMEYRWKELERVGCIAWFINGVEIPALTAYESLFRGLINHA